MSEPNTVNRPLSPHLQVYRLPLVAILSISHRITGVALSVGTLLLTWWVVSAAFGAEAYATATAFISSPLGYLFMFGWSVALFYHFCNGIRHLLWDIGKNFELSQTATANWVVISGTVILTGITWAIVLGGGL